MKYFIVYIFLCSFSVVMAQDLNKEAKRKIEVLQKLVRKARKSNINVLKEKTTIRTAEEFLKYANWDESNVEINERYFKKVASYKAEALKLAKELPYFERKDVNLMLDNAIENLQKLISGQIYRQESPDVDWAKVTVNKDQLTYNNRPVFITDYTWKPKVKELTDYHGNQDGFYLTPLNVRANGKVDPRVVEKLDSKPDGRLGFIFFNHKNVPDWTTKKYGKDFKMREDTYTAYDIDSPGARELQKTLLGTVIPKMAGKKYTELGYMLCNEPHFFVYKDKSKNKKPWATGPVSNYTIDKFKIWLKNKHKTIVRLNDAWNTKFFGFKNVSVDIPLDISLKGTALWYDWTAFNMDRVTEWYKFLKNEVTTHDPQGKVHIKIMPNLWTDNKRGHGIDLEALTELSGIIGNDSGADHTRIFGKPHEWEKEYAFEWRELCMGFDFMKSVSPNKINFNSELHYLSTVRSRNLFLNPNYARATFWLAHTYGMTVSQIWFWPRNPDGSVAQKAGKGYAGSNNQQPRVTNEVAMTLIDLNANSEIIMEMQRQRKPIRMFYSKTSAINNGTHMDNQFEMYRELHFEGIPIGFVTKNIIKKQDHKNWDVLVIYNTPNATRQEIGALQDYIDGGGRIIIDNESLQVDEYGKELPKLKISKGYIIKLQTISEIKEKALSIIKDKNLIPEIKIQEENTIGTKGCIWRVVKNSNGNNILSVVNVGKSEAKLKIMLNGSSAIVCKDIINGTKVSKTPILKPLEVYFVEVTQTKY
ncbi:alpha-amylase family protein [Aquimarina aggregata]|uniref:alpha-amylase family protein n=1 Tax=Aquimarina aggregata TaxID=1642818 RepID=UPI00249009C2|nr:beta-galactosidase [Aquimarina aggregata]